MNHEEIRHKLSEFIDGAITPGEKADIERHLKTCTECAEALAGLRKTIDHIHAVEEVEPPDWMTQKIMAKVREEQGAKMGLWQRVVAPILGQFPVQAVAVLFLAVTAFYIYSSINPAGKYTEEPVGMTANKKDLAVDKMREKDAAVRETVPEAKQAPRKPDYKSLDMKYAYEKPAPPVPQDRTIASAPAPANEVELLTGPEESASTEKRAAAPRAAAPSFMTEQAAPSAGAVQQTEASREARSEERAAKKAFDADRDADALLEVTGHFVKVDLPGKMKKKGLQYHTRKFDPGLTDLRWMGETKTFRASPCSNRYVVDVDLSGTLAKYLYCYDRSRIRLLGIYERRQDGWTERQH